MYMHMYVPFRLPSVFIVHVCVPFKVLLCVYAKEFKMGSEVFFQPCVNAVPF